MRPLQFATTVCGLFLVAILAEAAEVGRQLDGYMQVQVNRNHFTDMVLVAQDGKLLLAKGYGYANAVSQVTSR